LDEEPAEVAVERGRATRPVRLGPGLDDDPAVGRFGPVVREVNPKSDFLARVHRFQVGGLGQIE
jgi:hypothetical protein